MCLGIPQSVSETQYHRLVNCIEVPTIAPENSLHIQISFFLLPLKTGHPNREVGTFCWYPLGEEESALAQGKK